MRNRALLLSLVLVLALCGGVVTAGAGPSDGTAQATSGQELHTVSAPETLTASNPGTLTASNPGTLTASNPGTLTASGQEAPTLLSSPTTADSSATNADSLPEEQIAVSYTFDVDGEDPLTGSVTVEIPDAYQDRDGEFQIETFGLQVTSTEGFDGGGSTYTWDGETDEAVLSFETDVTRAIHFDGYDAYHAEDWALGLFGIDASYVEDGQAYDDAIVESTAPGTPEATVGAWMTFVGAHDTTAIDTGGQTVTLVVPEGSERDDHDELVAAIEDGGHDLRVGARSAEVVAIAAPDPIREGGLAYLHGDFWTHESAPIHTWLHEYVHARQGYQTAESAAWLTEAEAEFYPNLMFLEHDHPIDVPGTEFEEFQRVLGYDEDVDDPTNYEDVTLTDPETWEGTLADYRKGALVLAALDAEIRAATDGERTYADVTREFNAHDGVVDHDVFVETVEAVAGEPMDAFVDRYITGEEIPDPPTDPDAYGTWDEFDVSLAATLGEVAVSPGEDVTVPVSVTNDGTDPAVGVEATADVPDGWSVVDADGGTVSEGTVTWTEGELAPGDSIDGSITLLAPADADGIDDLELQVTDADENHVQTGVEGDTVTPPEAAIDAPAVAVAGEEVTIDAGENGADGAIERYEWDLTGDGAIDEETTEPTVPTAFETPDEREVSVTVVDEHGFADTATAEVLITDVPTVSIDGPTTPVADEPVALEAIVENEIGATTVTWELPDGSEVDGDQLEHTFEPGTHQISVTVTDEHGAEATATHELTAVEAPDIEIDAPETAVADEPIAIGAVVDADGVYTVEWQLPDGTQATGATVDHTFDAGTHVITAVVTDEYGAEAFSEHEITVEADETTDDADADVGDDTADSSDQSEDEAADGAVNEEPTETGDDWLADATPGYSVASALAALALAALVVVRNQG
ncbi:PKD domain-containing protein [Halobacteria archaeon AArc-dxtr1]|nr:PKD domain-containing protein [Halobacteria archaeon AArc-dxtr1]